MSKDKYPYSYSDRVKPVEEILQKHLKLTSICEKFSDEFRINILHAQRCTDTFSDHYVGKQILRKLSHLRVLTETSKQLKQLNHATFSSIPKEKNNALKLKIDLKKSECDSVVNVSNNFQ